jgi:hypothetical protein
VQDKTTGGDRSKGSDPKVAAVASRWTAAKTGAAASLWAAVPARGKRYLAKMVSAHSRSAPDKDQEP